MENSNEIESRNSELTELLYEAISDVIAGTTYRLIDIGDSLMQAYSILVLKKLRANKSMLVRMYTDEE